MMNDLDYFPILIEGTALAVLWMFAVWCVYRLINNPAIVDFGWTLSMGGLSLYYFSYADSENSVGAAAAVATTLWMMRLAGLIVYRLWRDRIDGRYETLDATWTSFRALRYLFFFCGQGLAAGFLMLPTLFVMIERQGQWGIIDTLGIAIITIGLIGETVADWQLQQFVRSPANHGEVCDQGLWRYSRHPNYFFEWMFWMGHATLALPTSWGMLALISPLALLSTLLFFTGIPPAEAQAIKSRGEKYRAYQRRTSAFVPWFTKKEC